MAIFVGTSGFSYKHWIGVLYPESLPQGKWIEYYAERFNTVELNVSFYRLPQKETFEGWRKRTPEEFTFSIKGSRYITHIKKLRDVENSIKLFFNRASGLGEKMGVVLWQLPPGLRANLELLGTFLGHLMKESMGIRQVFEFRNKSWFNEEVYQLLKENNSSLCVAHSLDWPTVKIVTADFVYLRFHGGETRYSSSYSDDELEEWATTAKQWIDKGRDVYAYFNNDAYGYAVKNAKTFRSKITT